MANEPSIAVLSGDLDFTARTEFHRSLAGLLDCERALVDLSKVTYIDSSALAELVWLRRERVGSGRSAPAIVISAQLKRIFDVAGLGDVFAVFASIEEARGA